MQNNLRKEFIVSQAFSCIFAGLFFLTLNDLPRILFFRGMGIAFLTVSLVLVISPTCERFLSKAEWISNRLQPAISSISMTMLVVVLITFIADNGGKSTWIVWVPSILCVIFMFLFIIQSAFLNTKALVVASRTKKARTLIIEALPIISIELATASIAALFLKAFSEEVILYMIAIAVILLSIAFLMKIEK